jgi:ribosome-associated toxin RatA of RatAB toxin-antitoxin module
MTTINRSALVMHSAQQMFDLVNDVARYPEFLQGCKATRVIAEGEDFIEASITTRNVLVRPESMEMRLVDGPFSKFKGVWRFQALSPEACKVSLDLEFEVSNRLAGAALGAVFKQVASSMVDAFVARGKQIYG